MANEISKVLKDKLDKLAAEILQAKTRSEIAEQEYKTVRSKMHQLMIDKKILSHNYEDMTFSNYKPKRTTLHVKDIVHFLLEELELSLDVLIDNEVVSLGKQKLNDLIKKHTLDLSSVEKHNIQQRLDGMYSVDISNDEPIFKVEKQKGGNTNGI